MLSLTDTMDDSAIKRIIGKCANSQKAIDLINEATRRLMRRGDWFETVIPMFVCVYNGCLVLPRCVQIIKKMNFCNREIQVRNEWYEMLAYNQNFCNWGSWLSGWLGQTCGITGQGTSPVFQDVQGEGRTIRCYARCRADIGKTMRVFGTDNNGQPLITKNLTTGAITQGSLITMTDQGSAVWGSTDTFVRHIDYVVRDETTCMTDVYAYNASTNLLEDIAHYQPTETTPTYARYKLSIPWPSAGTSCGSGQQPSCCQSRRGVVMMVKLRFVEAVNGYDLVMVPCLDALKLMIMAIMREDAYDRDGARTFERDAIEVMNRELESNSPDDQFSVGVNSLGPNTWQNQCF